MKIKVQNPIVEIDGDEMAHVMWQLIKDKIIIPYLDLKIQYFDLSIQNRDKTSDKITEEACHAINKVGVGVKCATITPDESRVKEFKLKKMYKSPNGTIRNIIGGTVFREPIICNNIPPYVHNWKQPIIIGRHSFADQYKATEMRFSKPTSLSLRTTDAQNVQIELQPGVLMVMYNHQDSIEKFARSCFQYSLNKRYNLFLSTKNTILREYDGMFMQIFDQIYREEFQESFAKVSIEYKHRLIDDMVAFAIKSEGGFVWACKNYDGDVMSDLVAQGFGSLGLMTSVLVNPTCTAVQTEAAHGTVTRHFREYQKGKTTSTNPIASIFAWTRGLDYRGNFDQNEELRNFALKVEKACIKTVESGIMTKDLGSLTKTSKIVTTEDFLDAVVDTLESS